MFLLMMVGYAIAKLGMVSREAFGQLNKAAYYFLFSAITFRSVYNGDLSKFTSPAVVIFCVVGILLEYFVGDKLAYRIDNTGKRHAVISQVFFRTNTLLLGIPLASALYEDYTVMVIVFAIVIPLFSAMSVMAFEKDRHGGKVNLKIALKNPILISTLAGLAFNILHIPIPTFVNSALGTMSTMGSGLAMVIVGSNFNLSGLKSHRGLVFAMCALRLVLLPGIFVTAALLLGFRDIEILSVLVVFGSAMATASYVMARELGGDADFAGEMVVFSHLFGFLTLFIWIFVLKTIGAM